MTQKTITVLISGSGTNLQALIDASESGALNGSITKVISSSPTAYGLTRAANHNIPTHVHDLQGEYYKGIPKEDKKGRQAARKKFNLDLAAYIQGQEPRPDLIVCAGWMLILSQDFLVEVEKLHIPIINLHPALPGQFAGINAIERAWAAGQEGKITTGGVMVHKVIAQVDEGEPLVVKEIPFSVASSLDEYIQKVHEVEHVAIVEGAKRVLG